MPLETSSSPSMAISARILRSLCLAEIPAVGDFRPSSDFLIRAGLWGICQELKWHKNCHQLQQDRDSRATKVPTTFPARSGSLKLADYDETGKVMPLNLKVAA